MATDENENEARRDNARRALDSLSLINEFGDDLEANIVDLITDLLHLAHHVHIDTDAVLRMAQYHFEEER